MAAPVVSANRAGPRLPEARGELSGAVLTSLTSAASSGTNGPLRYSPGSLAAADPLGEDVQLALHLLYELHYRGFDGVDDDREWDPELLRLRQEMEARFLHELRTRVPDGDRSVDEVFGPLLIEPVAPADGVGRFLETEGELWQVREYAALRSLYHLKEADPHAWVIPRLTGRAKAGMVAIEYDEFGAGRAEDIHARLFADLMDDLGLDSTYGRYVDHAPAPLLATVNLMSLFGLHRSLRGALVGHFGHVEVTSSPGSRRLARAMRRCGAGPAAARFYDEHVEADAVHEQVVRREVIGGLLADEPWLEADIAFGCAATTVLEDRLDAHIRASWSAGRSACRLPLPTVEPRDPEGGD